MKVRDPESRTCVFVAYRVCVRKVTAVLKPGLFAGGGARAPDDVTFLTHTLANSRKEEFLIPIGAKIL